MSAMLKCESCRKVMRVARDDAGKRVMCSACGWVNDAPQTIPLDPSPTTTDGASASFASIIARPPQPPPTPTQIARASPAPEPTPLRAATSWTLAALWLIVPALALFSAWLLRPGPRPVATEPAPPPTRPLTPAIGPPPAEIATVKPSSAALVRPLSAALRPFTRIQLPEPTPPRPAIARPPIQSIPIPHAGITDEQIGQSITKGAQYLLNQFQNHQIARAQFNSSANHTGTSALALYALLQAGLAIDDPLLDIRSDAMGRMIDALRVAPIDGHHETYARALRAIALSHSHRRDDRAQLRADVQWLVASSRKGAHTYNAPPRNEKEIYWDNSNSQYGLLGVWAGAEAGIEVPQSYWAQVQGHWYENQFPDGTWGYRTAGAGSGYLSMSVAGLASAFVTGDYLRKTPSLGGEPYSRPLALGLKWLSTDDNAVNPDAFSNWPGYTLFGLERVGLASGLKYFGRHDWYRLLSHSLVQQQSAAGSWGASSDPLDPLDALIGGRRRRQVSDNQIIETSYAILFLSRGRHPLFMTKLQFDGPWANRPRDLANLTRFATGELERPLNWQIVSIDRPWTDWLDSPVLYFSSHKAIPFTSEHLEKLRNFAHSGGLIFTQSDGATPAFTTFIEETGKRLFPNSQWTDLPPDHDLLTLSYRITDPPPLRILTNGSRILMLHSPQDLSLAWHMRHDRQRRNYFELGVNLFIYAAGKQDLRNRLVSSYLPPPPPRDDAFRINLAKVTHSGQWNPEPMAHDRFARWFEYQTGYALRVNDTTPSALNAQTTPIAHLTGVGQLTLSESDLNHLKTYVESGGTLLIDACGSDVDFAVSASALVNRAFSHALPKPLPQDHPIQKGLTPGMSPLPRPLRPYAELKLGQGAGQIHILSHGRGQILITPLDLTTALLATDHWPLPGHHPSFAQSLLKNTLLWTQDPQSP